MKPFKEIYNFSEEDWYKCIQVLQVLKDNPFQNPDNELFATLITKIHKKAKKEKRTASFSEKRATDLNVKRESVIAKNALGNRTLYSYQPKQKHTFKKVQIPQNCYACNSSFDEIHFFYHRLCPNCAIKNYEKRFLKMDLTNKQVILTGGRVKIGFATALKLLDLGANLTITTRFPALAFEQFSQQKDYKEWRNRLTIYGLDLRNYNAIQAFISFYKSKYAHLDILINNAAQTIKYPANYYVPLLEKEQKLIEQMEDNQLFIPNNTELSADVKNVLSLNENGISVDLNRFGQPVDLREKNSWNQTLNETSVEETVEATMINQLAPYILMKYFKPLMEKSVSDKKHIINVTSSEGIFSYKNKTKYHAHTNMTKAALNMLTLTASKDLIDSNILVNAVDVGWVSTGAHEQLRKKQFNQAYIPPLDSVDGASRIVDAISTAQEKNVHGELFKNYTISNW